MSNTWSTPSSTKETAPICMPIILLVSGWAGCRCSAARNSWPVGVMAAAAVAPAVVRMNFLRVLLAFMTPQLLALRAFSRRPLEICVKGVDPFVLIDESFPEIGVFGEKLIALHLLHCPAFLGGVDHERSGFFQHADELLNVCRARKRAVTGDDLH